MIGDARAGCQNRAERPIGHRRKAQAIRSGTAVRSGLAVMLRLALLLGLPLAGLGGFGLPLGGLRFRILAAVLLGDEVLEGDPLVALGDQRVRADAVPRACYLK